MRWYLCVCRCVCVCVCVCVCPAHRCMCTAWSCGSGATQSWGVACCRWLGRGSPGRCSARTGRRGTPAQSSSCPEWPTLAAPPPAACGRRSASGSGTLPCRNWRRRRCRPHPRAAPSPRQPAGPAVVCPRRAAGWAHADAPASVMRPPAAARAARSWAVWPRSRAAGRSRIAQSLPHAASRLRPAPRAHSRAPARRSGHRSRWRWGSSCRHPARPARWSCRRAGWSWRGCAGVVRRAHSPARRRGRRRWRAAGQWHHRGTHPPWWRWWPPGAAPRDGAGSPRSPAPSAWTRRRAAAYQSPSPGTGEEGLNHGHTSSSLLTVCIHSLPIIIILIICKG